MSGYNESGVGYQDNDTSKAAAHFNTRGKVTLRDQALQAFRQNRRMTTEQVSSILNRPEISVQPRVSELKNAGKIKDSGERKIGKWGTSVTVWELVEEENIK